jgi:hypothetical protein
VRYTASWRDAHYLTDPDQDQSVGTVMLTYSYLGPARARKR